LCLRLQIGEPTHIGIKLEVVWGDSGSVYKIGYQNGTFNTKECVFPYTKGCYLWHMWGKLHGFLHYNVQYVMFIVHISIYEVRLLLCLSNWYFPNHNASRYIFGTIGKALKNRGAPSWFHNVLICRGEIIEYWTIISLNIYLNQNEKL
jgi:hypothetical protein